MLRFVFLILILFATQVWASPGDLRQTPTVLLSFPKCPTATHNADLIEKMMEQILDIRNPWGMTLAGDKKEAFTLLKTNNELQIIDKVKGENIPVAASMCQDGDSLKVEMVAAALLNIQASNYIKLRQVNSHQVHITKIENGEESHSAGIFTAQTKVSR